MFQPDWLILRILYQSFEIVRLKSHQRSWYIYIFEPTVHAFYLYLKCNRNEMKEKTKQKKPAHNGTKNGFFLLAAPVPTELSMLTPNDFNQKNKT